MKFYTFEARVIELLLAYHIIEYNLDQDHITKKLNKSGRKFVTLQQAGVYNHPFPGTVTAAGDLRTNIANTFIRNHAARFILV